MKNKKFETRLKKTNFFKSKLNRIEWNFHCGNKYNDKRRYG